MSPSLYAAGYPRGLLVAVALLVGSIATAKPLAAQATITGQVVDERTRRPLVSVQIFIPELDIGSLTRPDGRYELSNVPVGVHTLMVQQLGYATASQEVTMVTDGTAQVNFALVTQALALDEIIVTGTAGGTERRAIGNAVTTIDASDLVAVVAPNNVSQLLNARAPGVVISQFSGTAGGGSSIRIRGHSSFSLGGQPLIYIDGVRVDNVTAAGEGGNLNRVAQSRLDDINPADIESIEIIKGPAAATLYGTEASGGVIQIITKRGQVGAPVFSVSTRLGANWMRDDLWPVTYEHIGNEIVSFDIVESEKANGTPLYQLGLYQGYALNISGGSQTVQYYASADIIDEEGYYPTTSFGQFNLRGTLTVTPSAELTITTSNSVTRSTTNAYDAGALFDQQRGQQREFDKQDGRRGFQTAPPEVTLAHRQNSLDVDRFTNSVTAEYRMIDWLSHRLTLGMDVIREGSVQLRRKPNEVGAQFYRSGSSSRGFRIDHLVDRSHVTVDYSVSANSSPSESLDLISSFGLQFYRDRRELAMLRGDEFAAFDLTTIGAAGRTTASSSFEEDTSLGVFFQQQFGWQDRLFLTAAVRADDHSAFGQSFNFITYPKVSGSWVVSEEPWWNIGIVEALRVRAAYGRTGQAPATFSSLRTYSPVGIGDGRPAFVPSNAGNANLGPERGEEVELGFEVALFDQRLNVDFTYYNQTTKDAILSRNVAPSEGFAGKTFVNQGELSNEGIELLLEGRVLERPNLAWDLSLNISHNDNKVVNLGGDSEISLSFNTQHVPGYPPASWWMRRIVEAEFIAVTDDPDGRQSRLATSWMCDSGPENDNRPVPCDEAPRVFFGPNLPTTEGAVSSDLLLWNRLRLHALVDFKLGQWVQSGDVRGRCSVRQICIDNHFGDTAEDAIILASLQNYPELSHYALQPASFTKLREIALSYALPDSWAARAGADRASVTLSGRNLYVWYDNEKFRLGDPENRRPRESDPQGSEAANPGGAQQTFTLPVQFRFVINLSF